MRYRNRAVYFASLAMVLAMLAVAVYFLFFDSVAPRNFWDVCLALAVPGVVTWTLIRVGLTPYVEWGKGCITVCNPFFTYRASLDSVRLLGREGRGGAFKIEGIGVVLPWAMTRSIFDGKRANAARRDLRHAVLASKNGDPALTSSRKARFGWFDLLIVPFAAALVWAFLP
ncbi:hypothetical protein AB0N06_30865 [Streptomyces sp. NPDC051020]|uniref:hypothetical protein n=1 Tax=Streptomyces sp. NPDC051020 TaxID=3155409 RepID=UPI0034462347